MVRLHGPFKEVWRGQPVRKNRVFSHIFHNGAHCKRLSRFHDVRSTRLDALLKAGWRPCRDCFPEFYAGRNRW